MTTAAGISLMVGLGNPGRDYDGTRHNAGFWFVDRIAEAQGGQFRVESKFFGEVCRLVVHGQDLRLLKPTTFMNHSGRSIAAVANYFGIPPERILVAYDELDVQPGQARLKFGGGHAGHNGMRDALAALGSRDFWRLRIGIGHPGQKAQVVGYVLSRPPEQDKRLIVDSIEEGFGVIDELVTGRFQRAMNALHRKPEISKDPGSSGAELG